MQPKFYADENVPLAVSNALKRRGIDVVTTQESYMLSRDDESQFSFAVSEKRVIITHDSDFLVLATMEKMNHNGILFFTKQIDIGQAIEEIEQVYLAYNAEELNGVILFLPQSH